MTSKQPLVGIIAWAESPLGGPGCAGEICGADAVPVEKASEQS